MGGQLEEGTDVPPSVAHVPPTERRVLPVHVYTGQAELEPNFLAGTITLSITYGTGTGPPTTAVVDATKWLKWHGTF